MTSSLGQPPHQLILTAGTWTTNRVTTDGRVVADIAAEVVSLTSWVTH